MRQLSGGAALDCDERGRLRLRVWSPTGEQVFHDLSSVEANAMREALNTADASQAAKAEQAAKDAVVAEQAARPPKPNKRRASGKET